MGTTIPDGYGQARLIWSLAGDVEEVVTTFGYFNANPRDASVAATLIYNQFVDNFTAADMSNAWSFLGVEVTQNVGGVMFAGEQRATVAGSNAAAPLPQNCALLVKKQTSQGGRQGRGRGYFPSAYLMEGDVSAIGIITAGVVTALQAKFTAFLADLDTATIPMTLLHSDPLNVPDDVTALVVDNRIATQRNRLRTR